MSKKPIRILQIVSSINTSSGVLSVVLNWHRNLDTSKIQFDYLYTLDTPVNSITEIEQLGGKCYKLPHPYQYPLKFIRETYHFFKKHHYHTIHSHITNLNFFFYPLAKLFGTKNVIQHAHGTKWSDKKLGAVRNYLMLHVVWPFITRKLACSQKAGKVFFGKNFEIINNGIDIDKFAYNIQTRNTKRKELGLEDKFVIGHIGRFSNEKNHKFLIDIFEALVQKEPSARLVLAGAGPLEEEIKSYVKSKNLQNKVLFLGVRKDVGDMYQAFDVFCLPSLHEGFGIVALEAQTAGLPCILADTLPREAFICNYKKLPIDCAAIWTEEIINFAKNFNRVDSSNKIQSAGFSVKETAQQMQKIYKDMNN